MEMLIGILIDVSGSMSVNAPARAGVQGGPWARSIFQVVDDLTKNDLTNEQKIFTGAFGVSTEKVSGWDEKVLDVLNTINRFQYHASSEKDDGKNITDANLEKILQVLETNGAWTIRTWASKETIKPSISNFDAELFLRIFKDDPQFLRTFVQDCLPGACRDENLGTLGQYAAKGLGFAAQGFGKMTRLDLTFATEEDVKQVVKKAKCLLLEPLHERSIMPSKTASEILRRSAGINTADDLTEQRLDELLKHIEPYIYGYTPLYSAVNAASGIFKHRAGQPRRDLLFVVSDGEPSEPKPCNFDDEIIYNLKKTVTIVCCYISSSTSGGIDTRRLYSKCQETWPAQAKLLFNLSSTIRTQDIPRSLFLKNDWSIDFDNNETRLFLHANHPDNIKDACALAKDVVCSHDALVDVLSDTGLDMYINQTVREAPVRTQNGETCYANAAATVMHLAMKRIIGRDGGYPEFESIRDKIIGHYGPGPQKTIDALQRFCPQHRLHVKQVDKNGALQAVVENRPVVVTFDLPGNEWDAFDYFFEQTPNKVLRREELVQRPPQRQNPSNSGRHAVVLVGFDSKGLRFMNSYGYHFGNGGFFKVQDEKVLRDMKFYDVYWEESQLTYSEKEMFALYGKQKAKELFDTYNGLKNAQYECPNCRRSSPLSNFTGTLTKVKCGQCQHEFSCTESGNILAMNIYLTSGMT